MKRSFDVSLWENWFAWRPVKTPDGWVWGAWVHRRVMHEVSFTHCGTKHRAYFEYAKGIK